MEANPLKGKLRDSLAAKAAPRVLSLHVLLLTGTSLLLFLLNARSLPLTDPEEARCGLIVRDILQHGHWLVPHLRGRPYFDKPAPFFWLAAAAVRLTGSAELGGRLIPALGGLVAVLVTYAFARRVFRSSSAGLLGTRQLACAAGADELQASSVCFWSNRKLSFLFYADLEDAEAFHHSRPGDLDSLVDRLRTDRPVYCLVTSPDRLAQLRHACQAELWTVASQGECSLVSNKRLAP